MQLSGRGGVSVEGGDSVEAQSPPVSPAYNEGSQAPELPRPTPTATPLWPDWTRSGRRDQVPPLASERLAPRRIRAGVYPESLPIGRLAGRPDI